MPPEKKEEVSDGTHRPGAGSCGAELGQPGRTHEQAAKEWDTIPSNPFGPMRRMPDPVGFGLAPAPGTGASRTCAHASDNRPALGGPHAEPRTNWADAVPRPSPRPDRGLDSPAASPAVARHPARGSSPSL